MGQSRDLDSDLSQWIPVVKSRNGALRHGKNLGTADGEETSFTFPGLMSRDHGGLLGDIIKL